MFERITEEDLNSRAMTRVSSTPSRRTAFGESGMSADDLKNRLDRMPRYLAGRINEIFVGIEDGSLAASLRTEHEGNELTLEQLFIKLLTGDVDFLKIEALTRKLSLYELANIVLRIDDGLNTGEIAERIVMRDGENFNDFYEQAKMFVNSDHDAIVKKVLESFTDVSEEGQ